MKTLKVIKIGGNIVDFPDALNTMLQEFAALEGEKILVHGGGRVATKVSAALGIETKMVEGRRVTDRETVEVVTMVYAGGVNKGIVSGLRGLGVNAWGVCGADGGLIPAAKRPVKDVDYGFVGDVTESEINTAGFEMLLENGYYPIVAPITIDPTGQLLNTNADTVAMSIAVAMSKHYQVELVYVFEKNGVLEDVDNPDSVIPEITAVNFTELKHSKKIFDGMIPKIQNALKAVESGVNSVRICNTVQQGHGTVIR